MDTILIGHVVAHLICHGSIDFVKGNMVGSVAVNRPVKDCVDFLELLVASKAVHCEVVDENVVRWAHDHVFCECFQLSRALDRWQLQVLPPAKRNDFFFDDVLMLLDIMVLIFSDFALTMFTAIIYLCIIIVLNLAFYHFHLCFIRVVWLS